MADFDVELFSEQELTCSICLEIFTEPVSTPCGHNFCQSCIGGYWASSSVCTCPLCKRPFGERPELCINRVFAHIAQKYKEKRYGEPPKPKPRQISISDGVSPTDADEQIFCDICSGKKQKAVSSCLTCTASYCEIHVLPHRQTSFYSSHRLLDPHEALRGRTCPQHGRLLEVYCRTDEKCVCAICVLEEHRTHTTVSIQTERAYKQVLHTDQYTRQNPSCRKRIKYLQKKCIFLYFTDISDNAQTLFNLAQNVKYRKNNCQNEWGKTLHINTVYCGQFLVFCHHNFVLFLISRSLDSHPLL